MPGKNRPSLLRKKNRFTAELAARRRNRGERLVQNDNGTDDPGPSLSMAGGQHPGASRLRQKKNKPTIWCNLCGRPKDTADCCRRKAFNNQTQKKKGEALGENDKAIVNEAMPTNEKGKRPAAQNDFHIPIIAKMAEITVTIDETTTNMNDLGIDLPEYVKLPPAQSNFHIPIIAKMAKTAPTMDEFATDMNDLGLDLPEYLKLPANHELVLVVGTGFAPGTTVDSLQKTMPLTGGLVQKCKPTANGKSVNAEILFRNRETADNFVVAINRLNVIAEDCYQINLNILKEPASLMDFEPEEKCMIRPMQPEGARALPEWMERNQAMNLVDVSAPYELGPPVATSNGKVGIPSTELPPPLSILDEPVISEQPAAKLEVNIVVPSPKKSPVSSTLDNSSTEQPAATLKPSLSGNPSPKTSATPSAPAATITKKPVVTIDLGIQYKKPVYQRLEFSISSDVAPEDVSEALTRFYKEYLEEVIYGRDDMMQDALQVARKPDAPNAAKLWQQWFDVEWEDILEQLEECTDISYGEGLCLRSIDRNDHPRGDRTRPVPIIIGGNIKFHLLKWAQKQPEPNPDLVAAYEKHIHVPLNKDRKVPIVAPSALNPRAKGLATPSANSGKAMLGQKSADGPTALHPRVKDFASLSTDEGVAILEQKFGVNTAGLKNGRLRDFLNATLTKAANEAALGKKPVGAPATLNPRAKDFSNPSPDVSKAVLAQTSADNPAALSPRAERTVTPSTDASNADLGQKSLGGSATLNPRVMRVLAPPSDPVAKARFFDHVPDEELDAEALRKRLTNRKKRAQKVKNKKKGDHASHRQDVRANAMMSRQAKELGIDDKTVSVEALDFNQSFRASSDGLLSPILRTQSRASSDKMNI